MCQAMLSDRQQLQRVFLAVTCFEIVVLARSLRASAGTS